MVRQCLTRKKDLLTIGAGRRSIASGRTKEFPQLQRDTVNEYLCRHRDHGDDEGLHVRVIAPAIEARRAAHVLLVDENERQLKLSATVLEPSLCFRSNRQRHARPGYTT